MDGMQRANGLIVGVDTGGTFTDVTLLDSATGEVWTGKVPSTPDDPSIGFQNAIESVLRFEAAGATADRGLHGATVDRALHGTRVDRVLRDATVDRVPHGATVDRVLHGTTIATNLILENKTAPAALLTNAGFRYVLEIGRNDVPRGSSLFSWIKPRRPVLPQHIFEIAGRIGPQGDEVEPLDEAAVRHAAAQIRAAGIRAVAIVFLHCYANAGHEQRAAAIVQEAYPEATVSLSSDVLPVFREYERSMTTILNVAVKPVVEAYVSRLEERLADLQISAPLLLMKSSGGVTSTRAARRAPVETALSGPAAGTIGAAFVGAAAGFRDVIGIDIGGTSADVSLCRNAEPSLTMRGRIGDWPLGLPVVDIRTIGAGGGSIARVSASGALTVGPESAGAQPGPACYGRGGTEPTVTDAHLVLGHLPPYLLGGAFALDAEAARRAIATRIAEPLGMDLMEAARGILAIVNHHMVGAVRLVSVERGHDPREFALLPFGGAGPLHGGDLAHLLGMTTVVVPPSPGVLSALGLLISNLKAEFSRTLQLPGGRLDLDKIGATYAALDRQARDWLDDEHVPTAARRVTWSAALRYRNQGFELHVPWAGTVVNAAASGATIRGFHELHERLYTFAQPDTPVEIVTLRVEAAGVFPPPPQPPLPEGGDIRDAVRGQVDMSLPEGATKAPVYDRSRLGAGAVLAGPAVITQFDSTTLLLPGQSAHVHGLGSLIVRDATG
jgi:N-methylhydantoinase A